MTFTDSGYLEIDAGVNNDRVFEAIQVVLDEVKKIKREGVTPLELRQAIDKSIGRTALALEHSDFVAQNMAEGALVENNLLTPLEELAKIKAVTLADILQVASEVFDEQHLNLAVVGPFKDPAPFKNLLKLS